MNLKDYKLNHLEVKAAGWGSEAGLVEDSVAGEEEAGEANPLNNL